MQSVAIRRSISSDCGFFFQAEDGIRGIGVTGVQTCALPIYGRSHLQQHVERRRQPDQDLGVRAPRRRRSEERRVGKEGRCRWGASHNKTKLLLILLLSSMLKSTKGNAINAHTS